VEFSEVFNLCSAQSLRVAGLRRRHMNWRGPLTPVESKRMQVEKVSRESQPRDYRGRENMAQKT
jgi:hypothetical protein